MSFLTCGEDRLILQCTYRQKEIAKSVLGASWNKLAKHWEYPMSFFCYEDLANKFKDLTVDPTLRAKTAGYISHQKALEEIKHGNFRDEPTYEWPEEYPPMKHQEVAFYFARKAKRAALFLDQGLGKTYIMCALMQDFYNRKRNINALVVCPFSVIENTWVEEIEKFTSLSCVPLVYSTDKNKKIIEKKFKAKKQAKQFNKDFNIYIVNFESLRPLESTLRKKEWDYIFVDESSFIKSPTAACTDSLIRLGENVENKIISSGTPAPLTGYDLWSQFMFLDGGKTLGDNFWHFQGKMGKGFTFTINRGQPNERDVTKWTITDRGEKETNRRIYHKTIKYERDEGLDLPPATFTNLDIEMSSEQKHCCQQMKEEMLTYLKGHPVSAREACSKIMKLRQITSGFMMKADAGVERIIPFDKNPKLEELDRLVEGICHHDKLIVWCNFRWEVRTILERYQEFGIVDCYGETPKTAKGQNIKNFRLSDKIKILVANPRSAGYGLNLTACHYSVFYSLDYNYERYRQAVDRICRNGQTEPQTIYFLLAKDPSIDYVIKKNILDKEVKMGQILKNSSPTKLLKEC
jgi:SNF2 family DNA or RNA helicase